MSGLYTTVPMEAGFFLAGVGAGVFAVFLYDLLRISRRLRKPKALAVHIQDVLYMAAVALILFWVAYIKNSGEIRWQELVGFALGAGLYIVTVKNRFLKLGTRLVELLVKILAKILRTVFLPLRLIFRLFRKPVSLIIWYTRRGARRVGHLSEQGRTRLKIRLKNAGLMLRKK